MTMVVNRAGVSPVDQFNRSIEILEGVCEKHLDLIPRYDVEENSPHNIGGSSFFYYTGCTSVVSYIGMTVFREYMQTTVPYSTELICGALALTSLIGNYRLHDLGEYKELSVRILTLADRVATCVNEMASLVPRKSPIDEKKVFEKDIDPKSLEITEDLLRKTELINELQKSIKAMQSANSAQAQEIKTLHRDLASHQNKQREYVERIAAQGNEIAEQSYVIEIKNKEVVAISKHWKREVNINHNLRVELVTKTGDICQQAQRIEALLQAQEALLQAQEESEKRLKCQEEQINNSNDQIESLTDQLNKVRLDESIKSNLSRISRSYREEKGRIPSDSE